VLREWVALGGWDSGRFFDPICAVAHLLPRLGDTARIGRNYCDAPLAGSPLRRAVAVS